MIILTRIHKIWYKGQEEWNESTNCWILQETTGSFTIIHVSHHAHIHANCKQVFYKNQGLLWIQDEGRGLRTIRICFPVENSYLNLNHTSMMSYVIYLDGWKPINCLSTEFLGVIIDSKLTWKQHISHISGKIARSTGMIIKAKYYLNKNALLTLYYSFVYPYFTYCNHVWGCTSYQSWQSIPITDKLIRIISNTRKREPISHTFDELGIIEFVKVNLYLTCRFMFRWFNRNVPIMFHHFCCP